VTVGDFVHQYAVHPDVLHGQPAAGKQCDYGTTAGVSDKREPYAMHVRVARCWAIAADEIVQNPPERATWARQQHGCLWGCDPNSPSDACGDGILQAPRAVRLPAREEHRQLRRMQCQLHAGTLLRDGITGTGAV